MFNNFFLATWGFGMTLAEDFDDLFIKIVSDMIIIEPICELD